jgi:hypothetical protein
MRKEMVWVLPLRVLIGSQAHGDKTGIQVASEHDNHAAFTKYPIAQDGRSQET